jgi:hypothetical protein
MKNHDLQEQLGRNARTTVIEKFSLDTMLTGTEAEYEEVLKRRQ